MMLTDAKNPWQNLTDNLLAVSVFFLPLLQLGSIICWGLLIIFRIFSGDYKNSFRNLFFYRQLLLFFLLFLFYLAGMLWTKNQSDGWEDILVKLPLLVFPLLFGSLRFSEASFRKIGIALLAGCLIAILLCFIHSYTLFLESQDPQNFFYTSFSMFLHPTYFTMYLNLALLFLCRDTFAENKKIFHSGIIRIFFFSILITGVILLNARLAMLTVFLTLLIFILAESIKRKKIGALFLRFFFQTLLTLGIFFSLIRLDNRFIQITDALQEHKDKTAILDSSTSIYYNSTTIRMGLFKNGLTVFKNNFLFGVGTGDVITETVDELNRSHMNFLSKHYTGAHNQYLQTGLSLGIFGLILLILCIIYPLKYYFQTKNYLGICFVLIVLFSAVGDTLLRASSLYFFSFFGSYLYVYNKKFTPD